MLRTAVVSILSLATMASGQITEPSAVSFGLSDKAFCWQDMDNYYIPDNQCSTMPGSKLEVNKITQTCRVFIYQNRDCTGGEMQVYAGQNGCYNIESYYSIKAFCH